MNWLNVGCFLLGLTMGMEIVYLVMKYRYDAVAENIRILNEKTSEVLTMNGRIIGKWSETINVNTEIIELNKELLEDNKELRKALGSDY